MICLFISFEIAFINLDTSLECPLDTYLVGSSRKNGAPFFVFWKFPKLKNEAKATIS